MKQTAAQKRTLLKQELRKSFESNGLPTGWIDWAKVAELREAKNTGKIPARLADQTTPTRRSRTPRPASSSKPVPAAQVASKSDQKAFLDFLRGVDADLADLFDKGHPVGLQWAESQTEAYDRYRVKLAREAAAKAAKIERETRTVETDSAVPQTTGRGQVYVDHGFTSTEPVKVPVPTDAEISAALTDDPWLKTWALADQALLVESFATLWGPPGTGKTFAGFSLSRKLGLPVWSFTVTDGTPSAYLQGMFIPRGGEFLFVKGPATLAFEYGGVLIVNEIDKGNADVQTFCYALGDSDAVAEITLPTGDKIRRHPNFRCILTLNEDPVVTLPEALNDRFRPVFIERPHPDAIACLPEDLQTAAKVTVCETDPDKRVGLRSWLAFAARRVDLGWDPKGSGEANDNRETLAARIVFNSRATDLVDAVRLARASRK